MEFDELEFWMAAVADYSRAADITMSERRINSE
jgi:hypothetical protein